MSKEKSIIKMDNSLARNLNKADLEVVEVELVELAKTVDKLNSYLSDLEEDSEVESA